MPKRKVPRGGMGSPPPSRSRIVSVREEQTPTLPVAVSNAPGPWDRWCWHAGVCTCLPLPRPVQFGPAVSRESEASRLREHVRHT